MLVANGDCDEEIARALGISGYTVREHIRRTFAKLGVSRRTAIVSYVLRSLKPDMRS
ncbi:response regulator transcription factor [Sphingomonas oryzagri]